MWGLLDMTNPADAAEFGRRLNEYRRTKMATLQLRKFDGDKKSTITSDDMEELRHISLLLASDQERYESVVLVTNEAAMTSQKHDGDNG